MTNQQTLTSRGFNGLLAGLALVLWLGDTYRTALSPHDQARLFQVLLTAFAGSTLLLDSWVGMARSSHLRPTTLLLLALLMTLATTACIEAPDRAAAFQDLALHMGLITLALAIAKANMRQPLPWFERALATSPAWLAGLTAVIYVTALSTGGPLNARQLHVGFDNPRFLNHAQTVFVPWLVVVYAETEVSRALRRLALAVAAFHIGLAYLGIARGTAVAWVVVLAVLTLVGARAQALRFGLTLAAGLFFGILAFDVLPSLLSRHWDIPFARPTELAHPHSRNVLWAQALTMIQTTPWLGQGPMQFATLTTARGAHPHDIYLQWAAEYGVPAAVLATVLICAPVGRALATARAAPMELAKPRLAGLAATCVAFLVDGCVSGNFVMPISQIWIACVFGQLLAALNEDAQQLSPPMSIGRKLVVAALCVSQLFLLVVTLQQGLQRDPHMPSADGASKPVGNLRPRFWLDGRV